jgi:hypothetical protein
MREKREFVSVILNYMEDKKAIKTLGVRGRGEPA